MLRHYCEIFLYFRKWIGLFVLIATGAAFLAGVARLGAAPKYTAAASIAVLPTTAEFEFGREAGAGPRSASLGLTATFMEYLKSRPVVEAALDRIAAGRKPAREPAPGFLASLARSLLGSAGRLYRWLDSGGYVEKSEKDKSVERLSEAIRLETVPSSFILRLSVSLGDPTAAAAAANALAEAYVQRVSEQFARSAGQIGGFLQHQIELRESELKALNAREEQLRKGLGTASLETERVRLLDSRDRERREFLDAQSALETAQAELSVLNSQNLAQSGRSVAELNTARSLAEARRQAAERMLELRRKSLAQLDATLAALQGREEPLAEAQRQIEVVKQELAELQTRMLSTNLAGSSPLATLRVIDPAVPPLYPSSPRVVRDTAGVFAASLVVAALFVLLADSTSRVVRTTVDLERVSGARCLGSIPSLLPGRRGRRGRFKREDSGAAIERELTLLGAFEAGIVHVTGFAEPERIGSAAATMASLLASRGVRVRCVLPRGVAAPAEAVKLGGDRVAFSAEGAGVEQGRLCIKCAPPVSASLRLADLVAEPAPVVCVLAIGGTEERDIREFGERAFRSGISSVAFALIDP